MGVTWFGLVWFGLVWFGLVSQRIYHLQTPAIYLKNRNSSPQRPALMEMGGAENAEKTNTLFRLSPQENLCHHTKVYNRSEIYQRQVRLSSLSVFSYKAFSWFTH